MEQETLKLTGVLSDSTRFGIYQYIVKRHKEVTVQDIAEAFEIHPNVARLHLTKLEDVSLLTSETKKSGKGGRPSRYYKISDQVVQIQFPFRDYERLAELAMQSLAKFGQEGKEALKEIGESFGKESVQQYTRHMNISVDELSKDEKLDVIRGVATQQGLNPELSLAENQEEIFFRIYNCPFKELINEHGSSLCSMHHAMFKGIFDSIFPGVYVKEEALMSDSELPFCSYRTAVL